MTIHRYQYFYAYAYAFDMYGVHLFASTGWPSLIMRRAWSPAAEMMSPLVVCVFRRSSISRRLQSQGRTALEGHKRSSA